MDTPTLSKYAGDYKQILPGLSLCGLLLKLFFAVWCLLITTQLFLKSRPLHTAACVVH